MYSKVLLANCSITLKDTKVGTLINGVYLLIIKENSFTVHNGRLQSSLFSCKYSEIEDKKDSIIIYYKNTSLTIHINNILGTLPLNSLSNSTLSKVNELQLRDKLVEKIKRSRQLDFIKEEYRTDVGNIDIFCYDRKNKEFMILELKSRQLKVEDIYQCKRYKDELLKNFDINISDGDKIEGYLIGPLPIQDNIRESGLENSIIVTDFKSFETSYSLNSCVLD